MTVRRGSRLRLFRRYLLEGLVVAAPIGVTVVVLRWIFVWLEVDPAVASSIFVTAFTDLSGFFLLLGLGSAILL